MKKGVWLILSLFILCFGLLTHAAMVEFSSIDDWGIVLGNGFWEEYRGAWIAGPASENWLGSLNTYRDFILEFDLIINGRTLVLVRCPALELPCYFGPGIDLVEPMDVRIRRWEDGNWSPVYEHFADLSTPYSYGELLHFKITAKDSTIRFEIINEFGDLVLDEKIDADHFNEAGHIWIRSTSPASESVIEKLRIEIL